MDFIFGLFFLWIIFNIFSGFAKKSKQQSKPTPWKPSQQRRRSETGVQPQTSENDELALLKSRVKSISKQQAVQFGRKAATQRAKREARNTDVETVNPARNLDAQDKNLHRREDWGTRAGPGILSTANILILLALALVVSLLIQFVSLL